MWKLYNTLCRIMKRIYDVLHRPFCCDGASHWGVIFLSLNCEGEPLKGYITLSTTHILEIFSLLPV